MRCLQAQYFTTRTTPSKLEFITVSATATLADVVQVAEYTHARIRLHRTGWKLAGRRFWMLQLCVQKTRPPILSLRFRQLGRRIHNACSSCPSAAYEYQLRTTYTYAHALCHLPLLDTQGSGSTQSMCLGAVGERIAATRK